MKNVIAATFISAAALTAPAMAGSLSDPVVVAPIEIMEDAVNSSGKPLAIVILTALILLAAAS